MTIIEILSKIIEGQEEEQKLNEDSIEFKKKEILKYRGFVIAEQKRITEIEKEIEENKKQTKQLEKIVNTLKEENCVEVGK